jgi:hypothetical protein
LDSIDGPLFCGNFPGGISINPGDREVEAGRISDSIIVTGSNNIINVSGSQNPQSRISVIVFEQNSSDSSDSSGVTVQTKRLENGGVSTTIEDSQGNTISQTNIRGGCGRIINGDEELAKLNQVSTDIKAKGKSDIY